MENLVGRQIGQYRIVAPLGEGGMAAVYKAYQPAMERYVAIKILPRHFAADPSFVRRFRREAKVIAGLEHPHILPVYDFGEEEGLTFLIMRYVEGQNLAQIMLGRPLPLDRICTLTRQIADALAYAHSRGVVHRDVKPANVLVDRRGECLLSDFGLAKVLVSSSHFTTSGAFLGTPTYASPEQCLGKNLDHRTDIYSLGVMLFEMAVGRPPYAADTPMAVVIKHVHDPLPLPRKLNPELPERVERVILKALAKAPDDRFQTMKDLADTLISAVESEVKPSVAATRPEEQATVLHPERETKPKASAQPVRPSERRRLPWWGAALGCMVFIGLLLGGGGTAAGIWWLSSHNAATAAIQSESAPTIAAGEPVVTQSEIAPLPTITKDSVPALNPPTAALSPSASPSLEATVIKQFNAPGEAIRALAWGNGFLWASALSGTNAVILKLDEDMQTVDVFKMPIGIGAQALAWISGTEFWASGGTNSNGIVVKKIKLSDHAAELLEEPRSGVIFDSGRRALAWDGESCWVAQDGAVFRIDLSGSLQDHFISPGSGTAFAWDGELLWAAAANRLAVIDAYGKTIIAVATTISDIGHLTWDGETLWASGNNRQEFGPDFAYIYQLDVESMREEGLARKKALHGNRRLVDVLRYDPWTSERFIAREGVLKVANATPYLLTIRFPDFGYTEEFKPGESRTIAPPGNSFTAEVSGMEAVQGSYDFDSNMNYEWSFLIAEPGSENP